MTLWSSNGRVAARLLNADGLPALIADGEGDGALTLELQSRFERPINLDWPGGDARASAQSHHIALSFRPGVLSAAAIEKLAGPNPGHDVLKEARLDWSIAFARPGRGEVATIYLLCKAKSGAPAWLIERTDAILEGSARPSFPPLVLHGLTARPELVGRGTQVEVAFSRRVKFEGAEMMYPPNVTLRMFVAHAARAREPALGGAARRPPLELNVGGDGAVNPEWNSDHPTILLVKNVSATEVIEADSLTLAVGLGEMTPETSDFLCDPRDLDIHDRPYLQLWQDKGGESGSWKHLQLEHVGEQSAPSAFRWTVPLPGGRLNPGATLALRMIAHSSPVPSLKGPSQHGPLTVELRYDWVGYGVGALSFRLPRHGRFDELSRAVNRLHQRLKTVATQAESTLQAAVAALNEAAQEPEIFGLPHPNFFDQPPKDVLNDPPKLRYSFYTEDGKIYCRPTLSGKYHLQVAHRAANLSFNVKRRFHDFIQFDKVLWFINQTTRSSNVITRIYVGMTSQGEHMPILHLNIQTNKPLDEVIDLRYGGQVPQ